MKSLISGVWICSYLLGLCLFLSCGSNSGSSSSDSHAHDHQHDHQHDHDHDHQHDHDHDHDHDHELEDGQVELSDEQFERLDMSWSVVEMGTFSRIIKTAGQLEAHVSQEKVLVARNPGIITFTNNRLVAGTAVRQGEVIAHISDQQIADGALISRNRLRLELAEQEFRRAEQLMQDSLISAAAYNQAKAALESARLADQTLSAAYSEQGVAHTSPLTGYIKNILTRQGTHVSAGDPIAVISTNQKLTLRADLTNSHAAHLPHIRSAHFKIAGDPTLYDLDTLQGRLLSFAKALNPENYRLPVYFEFTNTGHLLPGAFAEVYIKTSEIEALTLPLDALIEEQGNYSVYIREAAGLYRKQAVRVGDSDGERVHILAGLEPGTEVVTRGAYHLKLASMSSAIPHGHAH